MWICLRILLGWRFCFLYVIKKFLIGIFWELFLEFRISFVFKVMSGGIEFLIGDLFVMLLFIVFELWIWIELSLWIIFVKEGWRDWIVLNSFVYVMFVLMDSLFFVFVICLSLFIFVMLIIEFRFLKCFVI